MTYGTPTTLSLFYFIFPARSLLRVSYTFGSKQIGCSSYTILILCRARYIDAMEIIYYVYAPHTYTYIIPNVIRITHSTFIFTYSYEGKKKNWKYKKISIRKSYSLIRKSEYVFYSLSALTFRPYRPFNIHTIKSSPLFNNTAAQRLWKNNILIGCHGPHHIRFIYFFFSNLKIGFVV